MLPGGSLIALPGEVEEEMDRLAKLTRLRRLVEEAGGEIEGRKKLHKLVYLCQRANVDLDQSFVFHMYGVYSPSLALDLKSAIQWDLLEETPQGDAAVERRLTRRSSSGHPQTASYPFRRLPIG